MMEPIKVNTWWEHINEHPNFIGCLIDQSNDIAYFKNGKLHREDDPAIEWADGYKAWWLNGCKYISEQEWLIAVRKFKLEKILKQID